MSLRFLAAEEGEPNPLAPHLAEIVLALVVFLILVYLISKFVMPNFEKTFAKRTQAIEGGLAEAERKQAEADRQLADLNQRLSEARHEAARIREDAREQGAQIVVEMREQAQAEAARITANAHTQIEAEKQQVLGQLKMEVGTLATGLASRIVGESLEDEARQRRTVERFLAELESQPAGQSS
ncbi:MAG: F0F1 ATP synthase subunit B [Nocardioidaceae bacterium]|nr:F0F1 ATP synthase subunit B [Nocardioidaceae bacterium]